MSEGYAERDGYDISEYGRLIRENAKLVKQINDEIEARQKLAAFVSNHTTEKDRRIDELEAERSQLKDWLLWHQHLWPCLSGSPSAIAISVMQNLLAEIDQLKGRLRE